MHSLARAVIATARATEIERNSGATGFTLLKFRRSPVDRLVSSAQISSLELRAAFEFSSIFLDITKGCHYTDVNQMWRERQDTRATPGGASGAGEPTQEEIERWQRYKEFANYWSRLRKHGDPLLSVFVSAVVDQQPLEHIAQDNGLTVKQAERMIIKGLRDYARRAGWR